MTIGTIDENGESLIRLAVSASAEARPYEVDAVLDTGFEGRLALPRAFIESLNLRQTGHARYVTASGETHRTGTYRTAVAFGGRNVIIDEVIEAADPLPEQSCSGASESASTTLRAGALRSKNCEGKVGETVQITIS